jgi:hypothetical protein
VGKGLSKERIGGCAPLYAEPIDAVNRPRKIPLARRKSAVLRFQEIGLNANGLLPITFLQASGGL